MRGMSEVRKVEKFDFEEEHSRKRWKKKKKETEEIVTVRIMPR